MKKVCLALDLDETVFKKNLSLEAGKLWYISKAFWITQISALKKRLCENNIEFELAIITAKAGYDDLCAEAHVALHQFMTTEQATFTINLHGNEITKQGHPYNINNDMYAAADTHTYNALGRRDYQFTKEEIEEKKLITSFNVTKNPFVNFPQKWGRATLEGKRHLLETLLRDVAPYSDNFHEITKKILPTNLEDTHNLPNDILEFIYSCIKREEPKITGLRKSECLKTIKETFDLDRIILIDDCLANIIIARSNDHGAIWAKWKDSNDDNQVRKEIEEAFNETFKYLSETIEQNQKKGLLSQSPAFIRRTQSDPGKKRGLVGGEKPSKKRPCSAPPVATNDSFTQSTPAP